MDCASQATIHNWAMVTFRKCDICGKALGGPEAEQHEVENRRFDAAAGAVLQRETPRDLSSEAVCDECLEAYRRQIGQRDPSESPPG
jgi:hypothetical protein